MRNRALTRDHPHIKDGQLNSLCGRQNGAAAVGFQQALLIGASIGVAIAAPIGPMAIIVIRRTLAGGFLAGVTAGAGASTIHLLYATLATCGLKQIATYAQSNRNSMNVAVAAFLLVFAIKVLRRRETRADAAPVSGRSLIGNYASALALCLVNPMTFALLLSSIASIAGLSSTKAGQTSSIAAGVFVGSIGWWICLVGATTFVGIRLSPASIRMIDLMAGAIMIGLAVSAISRMM